MSAVFKNLRRATK